MSNGELDFVFGHVGAPVLQSANCWLWEFGFEDVPGKIVKEDVLACAWESIRETRLSQDAGSCAQSDKAER